MEAFYLITGFLSFIALLCFFVMCNNIDKMKINSDKQTLMIKKMFDLKGITLNEKETKLLHKK